jgi:cell division protein FtsZ
MNPEIGKRAAEETKTEIQDTIKGADMVFIAGGMGGGTGSGAAPIVARAAKEQGVLTVAVVTKPFFFEGNQRGRIAEEALRDLEKEVDAIITIPNDKLLQISGKEMGFREAFALCDNVLQQAVEGISDLITTPGVINVDFADIKSIMADTGSALMGIGLGSGEGRAVRAATEAINSPLLELSINGAKGVLFAISGGDDLTIYEIQEAAKVITESIDKEAKVIFGTIRDERLKKGEVKVTVIATGFPTDAPKRSLFSPSFAAASSEKMEQAPVKKEQPAQVQVQPAAPMNNEFMKRSGPEAPKDDIPAFGEDEDWTAVPAFLRRGKK